MMNFGRIWFNGISGIISSKSEERVRKNRSVSPEKTQRVDSQQP